MIPPFDPESYSPFRELIQKAHIYDPRVVYVN